MMQKILDENAPRTRQQPLSQVQRIYNLASSKLACLDKDALRSVHRRLVESLVLGRHYSVEAGWQYRTTDFVPNQRL
jgi:hypothetical protein